MDKYFTHTIQIQKYFLIALDYKIVYVNNSYGGYFMLIWYSVRNDWKSKVIEPIHMLTSL